MKITFDSRYNIAYIALRERVDHVATIQVSDELNIDLAPDGNIYGIELLNANEQLRLGNSEMVTFVNEASGQTSTVKIPA